MRRAVSVFLMGLLMIPPTADAGWFRIKPKFKPKAWTRQQPPPKVRSRTNVPSRYRSLRRREAVPNQTGKGGASEFMRDHMVGEGLKKGADELLGLDDDYRR